MVVRRRILLDAPATVFVTSTVVNWAPLFSNESVATATLLQLGETATRFDTSIVAYVLMPSHLHALLGFTRADQLSRFMQAFKGLSSRRILSHLSCGDRLNCGLGEVPPIWKPRFDDLIIWSEKQFRVKIEYIHNNPVRAGLVVSAADYKFSSAGDWLFNNPGMIKVDKNWSWYNGQAES